MTLVVGLIHFWHIVLLASGPFIILACFEAEKKFVQSENAVSITFMLKKNSSKTYSTGIPNWN